MAFWTPLNRVDKEQCKNYKLIAWDLENRCLVRMKGDKKTVMVQVKGKDSFFRLIESDKEEKSIQQKTDRE